MNYETNLDNMIIEPKIFGDDRGFFLETYQLDRYKDEVGINFNFVQITILVLRRMFFGPSFSNRKTTRKISSSC